MDDPDLIRRCISRDRGAWNEFVKRYSGLVYWAIEDRLKKWDYLYQRHDIEEIHQNVFLSLWKTNALEGVKDRKKIAPWLVVVSGNQAIDYFRRTRKQLPPHAISLFETTARKGKPLLIADMLASKELDPRAASEQDEIAAILEEEINGLAPQEKMILTLSIVYKKSYREIAGTLAIPPASAWRALKDIRQKLKKRLKGKI